MQRVFPGLERKIALCRMILSVVALVAIILDPTQPTLTRWVTLRGGSFVIDPYVLAVLLAHLGYSSAIYRLVAQPRWATRELGLATTWIDVLAGALIALLTEGITSPFYAFFVFPVVASGLRAGFRLSVAVTTTSTLLYLGLILIAGPEGTNFYVMRPIYLAIVGYLVGYLGQQRLDLENELREAAKAAQRHVIARDLHDSFAQTFTAIDVRIESCREQIARGQTAEALRGLGNLQEAVNREHGSLRHYIRLLGNLDTTRGSAGRRFEPAVSMTADCSASAHVFDQLLQILREGLANIRQHAKASTATIHVRSDATHLHLRIDDDGIGFKENAEAPWSISSRAKELGGSVAISRRGDKGVHLDITLPLAA